MADPGTAAGSGHRLRQICVGTDFSAQAEAAVETAANLARGTGASLALVAVVSPMPVYQKLLGHTQQPHLNDQARLEEARQNLRRTVALDCLRELPILEVAVLGSPSAALLAAAHDVKADLIAVGAGRRWRLDRLLLGGTAERVLRKAPVPVLVSKSVLALRPKVLLAPTDFSDASLPALREAASLARHWDARLVLLHTIEPIVETSIWPAEPNTMVLYPAEPAELAPEWKTLTEKLDLRSVRYEQMSLQGYAGATVVETAKKLSADIVVMGTHGRSFVSHAFLGSVTEHVARHAACAVLSVRPDASQFDLPGRPADN